MGAHAEISENQRGEYQSKPGNANRLDTEVAHVGIEGLATGDREHDGCENVQTRPTVSKEVVNGIMWRQGNEDLGVEGDVIDAEKPNGNEPKGHYGSEQNSDGTGTAALQNEKSDEDYAAERNDTAGPCWIGYGETFDGAQDRNCGSNNSVTKQEGGAHNREQRDECHTAGPGHAQIFRNQGK